MASELTFQCPGCGLIRYVALRSEPCSICKNRQATDGSHLPVIQATSSPQASAASALQAQIANADASDIRGRPTRTLPLPELVSEIAGDPENDELRLRYARRLTDEGNPLGRFITEDIASAQRARYTPRSYGNEEIDGRDFLPEHLRTVVFPIFRRGFVEEVEINILELPESGVEILFGVYPLLRHLQVRPRDSPSGDDISAAIDRLTKLLSYGGFSRIERLEFPSQWGEQGDRLASLVARRDSVGRLREVDFSFSGIGRRGISALLQSRNLPALSSLEIFHSPLSMSDVEPIAAEGSRLQKLNLNDNGLTPAVANLLASSTALERLQVLKLWGNPVGERGGRFIAESRAFPELVHLEVEDQTPESIARIITSRSIPRLRTLAVKGPKLGNDLARSLAKATPTHPVHKLWLSENQLGDKAVGILCESTFLITAEVRELMLSVNEITDRGAEIMARSPSLAGLKRLRLCFNKITAKGRALLLSSELLRGVELELD